MVPSAVTQTMSCMKQSWQGRNARSNSKSSRESTADKLTASTHSYLCKANTIGCTLCFGVPCCGLQRCIALFGAFAASPVEREFSLTSTENAFSSRCKRCLPRSEEHTSELQSLM